MWTSEGGQEINSGAWMVDEGLMLLAKIAESVDLSKVTCT